VRRLVGFILFLVFVDDYGAGYSQHMSSPMGWFHAQLLEPTIIKLRPFDLIMIAVLVAASFKRDARGPHVAPMRNAVLLTLATTVLWFAYGVVFRGGDARYASWQTYLPLSAILLTFTLAATFRTPQHFGGLARWVVAAALYRGLMCWLSYFTWGSAHLGESGAFLTSHEDTITWNVAIIVLIVNAVERRQRGVTLRNLAMIFFLVGAIQWNSRRLAWVSLAMALALMYVLFPQGAAKRVAKRVARIAVPVLAIYVIVGWGRRNPIFLPLQSLSSVSTSEDASTLARNAENLGLIATVNYTSDFTGSGWGWPYAALTNKYDISGAFELWQYMPHNSILGLLAFTGTLGFAGFWLAFPTAMFLNARVARLGNDVAARSAAIVGATQLAVCANQLYGDMGIFSNQTMYVIAVSYAMALRLPRVAGVWNAPNRKALAREG
jgi:hypothetical protein